MAFRMRDLAVIGYANGWTLWHYATVDAARAVTEAGYFAAASGLLRVGDRIQLVAGAVRDEQGVIRAASTHGELAVTATDPLVRTVLLVQAAA